MIMKIATSLTLLALVPFSAFAGVKVASVDLALNGSNGLLNIATTGRSSELPDVKVLGKTIEVTIDKADAFTAINKNVRGAILSANVLNGKAIIKATFPYNIPTEGVNLGWKNNGLEVVFPRGKVEKVSKASELEVSAVKDAEKAKQIEKAPEKKISKDHLNEDYLNNLMKESTEEAKQEKAKNDVKKDEVSVMQAVPVQAKAPAPVKTSQEQGNDFSFAGYALKFSIFLAMVLGLFYGVVQLLKKGVFSKGKLGFLNNTQMIEVLSTTYVSPKRTLMVVRAHKQIFLVANSESGFTFLSEMKDTSGLIKEGERQITGTDFDMNLNDAESIGLEAFKLKDDIMESTPVTEPAKGLAKLAEAKDDIVKFSDELKKKAKKLKPIEFN